ncbi:MAG: T9SS type A sorting domain-containing protein [Sphingobacteriales bacterium]|nr:MAG: T9SS type A sorting domain-containing protein [Sphingobacteriales bacterium]
MRRSTPDIPIYFYNFIRASRCRLHLTLLIAVQLIFCSLQQASAQGYIDMSTQFGSSGLEHPLGQRMKVLNGYTYFLSEVPGIGYPVTANAFQKILKGTSDLAFTKVNPDGTLAYSTYLGGTGTETTVAPITNRANLIEVDNAGVVFFTGISTSLSEAAPGGSVATSYPVTITTGPGAAPTTTGATVVATKLNTDGSIAYSRYIGANGSGYAYPYAMTVYNGDMYIVGFTNSASFPVVGNSTVFSGTDGDATGNSDNIFIAKLNASGNLIYSAFMGRAGQQVQKILVDASGVYITGITNTGNFTGAYSITDGSIYYAATSSIYAMKLNHACSRVYTTVMKGNAFSELYGMKLINGNVYFSGNTRSIDYPSTSGRGHAGGVSDAFITKLSPAGTILFSTLIGGSSSETNGAHIDVDNSNVYFLTTSASNDLPVTDGSRFGGSQDLAFFKLNPTNGNILFGTYLGGSNNDQAGGVVGIAGEAFITGNTAGANFPTTNGTTLYGLQDILFLKLSTTGKILYSTYLGGQSSNTNPAGMYVENGDVYIGGSARTNFPVTLNPAYKGANTDNFVTRFKMCATGYNIGTGVVTPATQTTCKNGLGVLIEADSVYLPGSAMPTIYREGIPSTQPGDKAIRYQWQRSNAAAGPWTNIPEAILKNYLPSLAGVSQYYRRLTMSGCNDIIATSNVATVLAGANTAAVANAGGVFNTCPGTSVTIGGSPAAAGGTSPYAYSWDMGAGAIANPVVSSGVSTIYTLTITDANGCKSLDQAVVTAASANAGSDVSFCGGTAGVRIGAAPVAGLAGVTYSWSPATGLSCSTCAQPTASPATTTVYTLTMTMPVTGGGTCVTTDAVTVTPVAAPVTANFAGPDRIACLSTTTTPLGTAAETGFTYTWTPGAYLSVYSTATTNYQPGNILMPLSNPLTYYLTATKGGCYFVDSVKVASIEARAGIDGCGPRLLGELDRTPAIGETYAWTILSGAGRFVGGGTTSSEVRPAVTASPAGSPTTYRLRVTYTMGSVTQSCTDDVIVNPGCVCNVLITPFSKVGCPSYNLGGGANNVGMTAKPLSGLPSDYTYSWAPAVGLSSTTGETVYLTDNVARTYTCTITSIIDPSVTCSNTIAVNNTSWTVPTFTAQSVNTCPGTPVNIGQAAVAGYSYAWANPNSSLNSATVSNPLATVNNTTQFPVVVTDNISGCYTKDTAIVTALSSPANAGPDWYVCSNAIVKLGSPALPNTTYSWSPAASPWQNGTSNSSAEPEVLVATNLAFTVTATNTVTGCTSTDQVQIFVNNSPTIANFPDTTVCVGVPVKIGAPALPGVTYSWAPSTGLSDPTVAQPIATPSGNITYTVTATFPGSCANTATDAVTLTVSNPAFTLPSISYCPSAGAINLGAAAPAGMATYSWMPGNAVSNSNIANPTTLNPPPSVTSVYELTVTNALGCIAKNAVTVTPTLAAPIAGESGTVCLGSSVQLGSSANPAGATYSWSPATGLNNAAIGNPVFTPTTTGTTTFTVTKTEGGCTATATVRIMVNSFDISAVASQIICTGSCVTIGLNPVIGASYAWSPSTGLSDPLIANPTACVTSNTAYTLTAKGINGCVATKTIIVGVNSAAAPVISIPPVNACFANNASFNPVISPAGPYNYLWTPNDGKLSNIYVLNPSIQTSFVGTKSYSFEITNTSNGCAGRATGTVNVNYCVLPVKLVNFTATKQQDDVMVNWLVSEEINTLQYEVEFSTNGRIFNNIGKISAAGKSNYSLHHKTPVNGINYYRLKITDKEGEVSYSRIITIVVDNGSLVNVYPNPAYDKVSIVVAGTMVNKAAKINILSADGKLVYSKAVSKLNQIEVIHIAGMASGKYFINIITGNEVFNKALNIIH